MKLEVKPEKMEPEAVDLLSTTPRTIADRKKRQALLIQLARSGQSPPEPTSSSTNTEKPQSDDAPSQAETPKQAQLKRWVSCNFLYIQMLNNVVPCGYAIVDRFDTLFSLLIHLVN